MAAVTIFDGLRVTSDAREYIQKWAYIIRVFLRCIDREKGHYLRFPFPGCEREQPVKTMMAFDLLQQIFIKLINDRIEAQQAKIKAGRIGRQ